MNIQQPLFILGSPRSGTSLLRLVLTSHSQIVIPPECGFIVWLHEKFKSWSVRDARDFSAGGAFLADLYSCKKFDTWAIDRACLNELMAELQPKNYAELCSLVYAAYMRKLGRRALLWGDKNNFYINYLPLLEEIYPRARFLHIVRDGRDVACSYREVMAKPSSSPYAPKLSTDIEAIGKEWSSNVVRVEDYLNKIDSAMRMTIRYEDLVSKPQFVIPVVCKWLGLDYEVEMLAFHDANQRLQLEPALTMDWKHRTMEPISANTVGRYRNLLSAEEQTLFLRAAAPGLARLGYSA